MARSPIEDFLSDLDCQSLLGDNRELGSVFVVRILSTLPFVAYSNCWPSICP